MKNATTRVVLIILCTLLLAYAIWLFVALRRTPRRQVYNVGAEQSLVRNVAGWDWERDWEITGDHIPGGFGQHCEEVERVITSGPGHLEADTQVLYRDNDTSWQFIKLSDRHIKWSACANNCTFSCDTLKLHLMSRVVVPLAEKAEKWGVYAERTNEGNNLSCWVCTPSSAGTAACLGTKLIPDTDFELQDQARAAACVLKRRGKCLEVQNHRCP